MQNLTEIVHHSTAIEGGGEVIALGTGAVITAEAEAMLQALHSRSVGGLKGHLEVLAKRGADNFMKNFYVGYGHKSIGDCGTTSLFIEGVSLLVAKAIQDSPLYSGQEASTRYIDFNTQPFKNPLGTKEGEEILEAWRTFYQESMEPTKEYLRKQFPLGEGEDAGIYQKAISARAFDVLRGFLPAGATTNLAWHTNLRQAADKLMMLRHHPLLEVRQTADALEATLQKAFPNSFGHKRYEETESYDEYCMRNDYYYHDPACPEFAVSNNHIDPKLLPKETLSKRPAKTELPKHLAEAGTMQFEFLLDFGSFRDLQRHRNGVCQIPLIDGHYGLNPWYLDQFAAHLGNQARTPVISNARNRIAKFAQNDRLDVVHIRFPIG